jgi:hypothetical protein
MPLQGDHRKPGVLGFRTVLDQVHKAAAWLIGIFSMQRLYEYFRSLISPENCASSCL